MNPSARNGPRLREIARATWGGIWALLFPVFLLVGLRFGIFTPSEIGAFAVVYAVVIGLFAYRMLKAASFARRSRQPVTSAR